MNTHRDPKVKDRAILWAKKVMSLKHNYVILDTETSGLNKNDVILELAIIDLDGNVLYNSKIKPTKRKRISKEAIEIHGIQITDLQDSPNFSQIVNIIKEIIGERKVIIYNAEYDERLIDQTCEQDECDYLNIKSECAMIPYSEFIGRWSNYHQDFIFQRLPGGDHSAIGDCLATLKILKKMANAELTNSIDNNNLSEEKTNTVISNSKKKNWWEFWK